MLPVQGKPLCSPFFLGPRGWLLVITTASLPERGLDQRIRVSLANPNAKTGRNPAMSEGPRNLSCQGLNQKKGPRDAPLHDETHRFLTSASACSVLHLSARVRHSLPPSLGHRLDHGIGLASRREPSASRRHRSGPTTDGIQKPHSMGWHNRDQPWG